MVVSRLFGALTLAAALSAAAAPAPARPETPAPAAAQAPDPAPVTIEGPEPAPAQPTPAATPQVDAQAAEAPPVTISNPDLFEKSLQVASKALEFFGASTDREQRERVADIGYRVAQEANFHAFPFTFHVVDMPAPNAFALPGGHLFVTRGMLEMGVTDDMLAGLIGHEVAHVVREHGTRMQRRAGLLQVLSQVLVAGVLVQASQSRDRDRGDGPRAPYDPRVGSDNRTGDMVQGTAATGLVVTELLLRGYSRDFEREADDEGQRYAAGAGFDPAGLRDLMALMEVRLPQSKEYGYWQTHPFFEERVRGSQARAAILTRLAPSSADAYRQKTQEVLLDWLAKQKSVPEEAPVVEDEALLAWPKGPRADQIRIARVHERREEELGKNAGSRDYGALIGLYREEIAEVEELDPESPLLATLRDELGELSHQVRELYPEAREVVTAGVYETAFLETFLSNYPDSPEAPRVALALGDAYARRGEAGKAVSQYLEAMAADPDTPEGERARQGLRNLAPVLDDLAALEKLVRQEEDAELAELAGRRLAAVAGGFKELANGAEYLKHYPNGEVADTVTTRLNALADDLYTEVVLYQGVGDSVKALDRINKILTHAPASPAAAQIRDRAVVGS